MLKKIHVVVGILFMFNCCTTYTFAETNLQNDTVAIEIIIQEVARGWEMADASPFNEHFLGQSGARYIEGGGQNAGLDDLVEHHVIPGGEYLSNFELKVDPVEIHIEGDVAWAIGDVEVTATVVEDQRELHSRGYQTILFRKMDAHWKIIHTHSSSRPVKKEERIH